MIILKISASNSFERIISFIISQRIVTFLTVHERNRKILEFLVAIESQKRKRGLALPQTDPERNPQITDFSRVIKGMP